MAMTLAKMAETYYSDCIVTEVLEQERIKSMLDSKTSCCWGSGSEVADGWVFLCQPSRQSADNKICVFVCRKENLPN